MVVFSSKINKNDNVFLQRQQYMQSLLDQLDSFYAHQVGSLKPTYDLDQRSQLDVWTRIYKLIDHDSPFLEIMALAGDGQRPAGAVCGLGKVKQRWVVIFASDPKILGGTLTVYVYQKWARALAIAKDNRLPYISLVESAGFDLRQTQALDKQLVMPHFGATGKEFYDLTQLSSAGIPTIAIVFGSATAGGAYQPGLSDYTIFIASQSQVYLAGPPLVKAATGQTVDGESLGGARMHCHQSGLGDYYCQDEIEALMTCRTIVDHFEPQNAFNTSFNPPKFSLEDLLGWQDPDHKAPVDVKELIVRFVDDSEFHVFKPDFGPEIECVFARLYGHEVGIIGNQGVIFPNASKKAAHFIQLCNQKNCPLIFLHNTTGFMVGKTYEEAGIIKNGAQLINAVSHSKVPHITLVFGASYGAGTYAMSGQAFDNRFIFSWPNAKMDVMGDQQVAEVLGTLKENKAKRLNQPIDPQSHQAYLATIRQSASENANAFTKSRLCADDGIIHPKDTRHVLGLCCEIVSKEPIKGSKAYGVFRF